MQCCSETHRGRRKGIRTLRPRFTKQQAPRLHIEEVDTVDHGQRSVEKLGDVLLADSRWKEPELRRGIHGLDHLRRHFDLLSPEGVDSGAHLPIHIGQLELVHIGERKASESEPRESESMVATNSAETRDGHAGAPHLFLFRP